MFVLQVGFVMFYVRSPCEGGQEAIAGASSLLWMVSCVAVTLVPGEVLAGTKIPGSQGREL